MNVFEECPRCEEFFDKQSNSEQESSALCPECRPQEMLSFSKETLLCMIRQSVKEEFHIRRDRLLDLVGSTCNSSTTENREADAGGGQINVEAVVRASPSVASQAAQLPGYQLPDVLDQQKEDRKLPAQQKEARVEILGDSSSEECTAQLLSGASKGEIKRVQPKDRKKLKGCLKSLQDHLCPGINDPAPNDALAIGAITTEGKRWQCSDPDCLFQNLEMNKKCRGAHCRKSALGPSRKKNSLRTSIAIKNWNDAVTGNNAKSAYVHLRHVPRKYEAPAQQSSSARQQLDVFVQLMWQELEKHKSGEPWDKTIFDGPFVEALPHDFPGYYKVHLNNDYLRKVFDGKLPRELQIKELAGKKSMVFLNENPGQCVSHFDTDTAVLWPLAGSKEVCISKVLPSLSGRAAQKATDGGRTLYPHVDPFALTDEECRMGSWARVHVPASDAFVIPVDMIHCVKSAAQTVAVSIQIEPAKYLTKYEVGSGREETTKRNKQDGRPEPIFFKKARLQVKQESTTRDVTSGDVGMSLSTPNKGNILPAMSATSNGEINRRSPRDKSPQCGVCKKGFYFNGGLMQMLMTKDGLQPATWSGIPELICDGNDNECKPEHVPAHLTYKCGVSRDDYYSAVLNEPRVYDNANEA